MAFWEKLLQAEAQDQEQLLQTARQVLDFVKLKQLDFPETVEDKGFCKVVYEERLGAYFVHIVPRELWPLFRQAQIKEPQELALLQNNSVLARSYKRAEVRVICYGLKREESLA